MITVIYRYINLSYYGDSLINGWIMLSVKIISMEKCVQLNHIIQINQKKLNIKMKQYYNRMHIRVESKAEQCCVPEGISGCRVESIISVDERGQMVLPKEIREKAKIKSGDKLALVSMEKNGKICCLSLIRVEELEGMVKSILGPVMDEILKR